MIRIFKAGAHAHRTPLSYPALAPLWEGDIRQVDTPDEADMHVFAHVLDIQNTSHAVIEDWRARHRPIVLLSEEPFWDTIWGRQPLDSLLYVETRFGAVPVHQLNHTTSNIYRFDHIPYFLLTNPRFAKAYIARFGRGAGLSVADWQSRLSAAEWKVGFMFERRPEAYHDVVWPAGDITGLCAWRTRMAEACQGDQVRCWGHSWDGGSSRFNLGGCWHRDKITRLDGRCRILGAIENTHQPDYITEKVFDALACGSVPLYWASADHRIHEFGLPEDAWINLYGLSSEAAADKVMAHDCTAHTARALREASQHLSTRFGDPSHWQHERTRLKKSVITALETLL